MSASTQCPHSDPHFNLELAAFGDTNIRYLEITGHCNVCGAALRFLGLPLGLTPSRPTGALDGSEARLPVMFGEEEYDGKAVGFTGGPSHPEGGER